MVVSAITTGVSGNPPGTKLVQEKKEVNVINLASGTVALAVSDVSGTMPSDSTHQNYRRISINLNVTTGTAIQIDNVIGRDGTDTIDSIAPNGYRIDEIFIEPYSVPNYDVDVILFRNGTATTNIVSEMNINEGRISLTGGEKNNGFSTDVTHINFIRYTGPINIVVGFWY